MFRLGAERIFVILLYLQKQLQKALFKTQEVLELLILKKFLILKSVLVRFY